MQFKIMAKITCFLLCYLVIVVAAAVPVTRNDVDIDEAEENESIKNFVPDRQIFYSLFTRNEPNLRQPLLLDNEGLLKLVDFQNSRRTVIVIHGRDGDENSYVNQEVVPAVLEAANVNVIVVDWSAGATGFWPSTIVKKAIIVADSIARFVKFLETAANLDLTTVHIVGHGHGAHVGGIVGRNLGGNIGYITGLDPSYSGWSSSDRFSDYDGIYTEVIHTTATTVGFGIQLGQTDFYPNNGSNMPGCSLLDINCNHDRAVDYFAESVKTGGFKATKCSGHLAALSGLCISWNTLNLGGLTPKTGTYGPYNLSTNSQSPFSQK